jgi:hypothetical protein
LGRIQDTNTIEPPFCDLGIMAKVDVLWFSPLLAMKHTNIQHWYLNPLLIGTMDLGFLLFWSRVGVQDVVRGYLVKKYLSWKVFQITLVYRLLFVKLALILPMQTKNIYTIFEMKQLIHFMDILPWNVLFHQII